MPELRQPRQHLRPLRWTAGVPGVRMTDYREWLASFDEIEDNGKAAEAALDDLGQLTARARSLLLPILTEAFLMARRTRTRRAERAVPIRSVLTGSTSLERRASRLA